MSILNYILFCFYLYNQQINHFIFRYSTSFVLHTFPTLVPYGFDVILLKICSLLSSLLLNAILLISSVYPLCASLLSLCCDFNMI